MRTGKVLSTHMLTGLMLAAATATQLPYLTGYEQLPTIQSTRKKVKKNCLNCNEEHTYHTGYCSPQCCKSYRRKWPKKAF